MKHFYIIPNLQKDVDLKAARKIRDFLTERGVQCTLQETAAGPVLRNYKSTDPKCVPEDVDCVLVLGGDGTVLRAARDLVGRHLPLFGINLGTLGYLAEVDMDHMEEALEHLIADEYVTEERMMLKGTARHHRKKLLSDVALNDIVIARSSQMHVRDFRIYVNDRYLNSYTADGVIVSTPTGSTGYNLSAGGPIVAPAASLIMITPIAPHTLSARSVVLPDTARVKIVIGQRNSLDQDAEACFDGDTAIKLTTDDSIVIEKAESTVKLVKIDQISFLETLRRKMSGT